MSNDGNLFHASWGRFYGDDVMDVEACKDEGNEVPRVGWMCILKEVGPTIKEKIMRHQEDIYPRWT